MPDQPIDPALLESVDAIGHTLWSGTTYRHTAPRTNPISGAGARAFGGRWNAPSLLVSTIYLAQPRATCVAEFHRMAAGQAKGAASFLPRALHEIEVTELRVIDLTDGRHELVGLDARDLAGEWGPCQLVGAAAHFLGATGIVVPSATGLGVTLAVFETRVRGELRLVATEMIEEL